jgi:hypothetical protein
MSKRLALAFTCFAFAVLQIPYLATSNARNAESNLQIMLRAARSLKLSLPENRPFLLEKASSASQVAIIFGYVDNRSACEQIAGALTESLGAGLFRCNAIY